MSRIFKMTFVQLKKFGVIFTALSIFMGALPGIMATADRGPMDLSFNMISYLLFILVAPIIAYSCFSFLNKRNSSDYYHSMAATRKQLFFGRLLGGIAWQTVFAAVNCISAVVSYKIFAVDVLVDYAVLVSFFVAIYIISLLVMAAFSLAMSLTTGALYNFFGVFVILFLGRIIIEFIIMAITAVNYKIADYTCVAGIFNKKYNMLWGILSAASDDSFSLEKQISLVSAHIYTLILTLVIIFLAAWAFSARRSEIAQARNPKKIELAMKVVLAVIAFVMCAFIRYTEGIHELPVWGFVMGFCLALIIAVVCDYIAKRKHIISGVVTIAVCALIFGIICIANYKYNNFKPLADDIESIRISVSDDEFGELLIRRAFGDGVQTKDESTIKFFCDAYDNRDAKSKLEEDQKYKHINIYVTYGEGLSKTTVKQNIVFTDEVLDILYRDKNISDVIYGSLPDASEINYELMDVPSKEKKKEIANLYVAMKNDIEKYRPKEYIIASFGRFVGKSIIVQFTAMENAFLPVLESMPESFEYYYKYTNDRVYNLGYDSKAFSKFFVSGNDLTNTIFYNVDELNESEMGKKLVSDLFAKYANHEQIKAGEKGDLVALVFDNDTYWVRVENIENKVD